MMMRVRDTCSVCCRFHIVLDDAAMSSGQLGTITTDVLTKSSRRHRLALLSQDEE